MGSWLTDQSIGLVSIGAGSRAQWSPCGHSIGRGEAANADQIVPERRRHASGADAQGFFGEMRRAPLRQFTPIASSVQGENLLENLLALSDGRTAESEVRPSRPFGDRISCVSASPRLDVVNEICEG